MNANFEELAVIASILANKDIKAVGLIHANYGCSSYQLQYSAYGLEFYLDRCELEMQCKNKLSGKLSTFIKIAGESHRAFYQLVK